VNVSACVGNAKRAKGRAEETPPKRKTRLSQLGWLESRRTYTGICLQGAFTGRVAWRSLTKYTPQSWFIKMCSVSVKDRRTFGATTTTRRVSSHTTRKNRGTTRCRVRTAYVRICVRACVDVGKTRRAGTPEKADRDTATCEIKLIARRTVRLRLYCRLRLVGLARARRSRPSVRETDRTHAKSHEAARSEFDDGRYVSTYDEAGATQHGYHGDRD